MRPTLTQDEILKLALMSVVLGIIVGVLYDIFRAIRIFRARQKPPRALVIAHHVLCFFEDLLFFLGVTVLNVLHLSAYGAGTLRLDAILIEFIFFLVWRLTAGRFTPEIVKLQKKLITKAIKLAAEPIKKLIGRSKNKKRAKRIVKYSKKAREKLKKDFRAP